MLATRSRSPFLGRSAGCANVLIGVDDECAHVVPRLAARRAPAINRSTSAITAPGRWLPAWHGARQYRGTHARRRRHSRAVSMRIVNGSAGRAHVRLMRDICSRFIPAADVGIANRDWRTRKRERGGSVASVSSPSLAHERPAQRLENVGSSSTSKKSRHASPPGARRYGRQRVPGPHRPSAAIRPRSAAARAFRVHPHRAPAASRRRRARARPPQQRPQTRVAATTQSSARPAWRIGETCARRWHAAAPTPARRFGRTRARPAIAPRAPNADPARPARIEALDQFTGRIAAGTEAERAPCAVLRWQRVRSACHEAGESGARREPEAVTLTAKRRAFLAAVEVFEQTVTRSSDRRSRVAHFTQTRRCRPRRRREQ